LERDRIGKVEPYNDAPQPTLWVVQYSFVGVYPDFSLQVVFKKMQVT
jgi:hypothetical protein